MRSLTSDMAPHHAPLVCLETLQALEAALNGARSHCRYFVLLYIDRWPHRFTRLHDALTAGDLEAAMDATLSLRSASVMVGASRLGVLATDIVNHLEEGQNTAAAQLLAVVRWCGDKTMHQLKSSDLNRA